MIKPKEITIDGKVYILSKFTPVEGREIVSQYLVTAIPKIGDYKVNQEMMLKLMSYVAIPRDNGTPLQLTKLELINNHVESWETLMKIEAAMMEYNCSFFQDGRVSTFLEDIAQKAQALISKMLMGSSEQSSLPTKPLSTN